MSLIHLSLWFAFACFTIALALNLWRLVIGPDASDRLLALDTMTMNVVAVLALLGMAAQQTVFVEAALLYAMFGFVSTVAFARYRLTGRVLD